MMAKTVSIPEVIKTIQQFKPLNDYSEVRAFIERVYNDAGILLLPFWETHTDFVYCKGWNKIDNLDDVMRCLEDNIRYFKLFKLVGFTILTKPSGLTVIDVDDVELFEKYLNKKIEDIIKDWNTLTIQTKSQGYHFYFFEKGIPAENNLECCGYEVKSFDKNNRTLQVNVSYWDGDRQLYSVVNEGVEGQRYPLQSIKNNIKASVDNNIISSLNTNNKVNNFNELKTLIKTLATPEIYEKIYSFDLQQIRGYDYINYLCPFHPENNPSFSIFKSDKGEWIWKDHHDDKSGDIIEFYRQVKNVSFIEALTDLASLLNLNINIQQLKEDIPFLEKDWIVYDKKGQEIGPAIEFIYKYKDNEGIYHYKIQHNNKTFELQKLSDLQSLINKTELFIISEKKYKEYINFKIKNSNIQEKLYLTNTGWNDDYVFLHPAIQQDAIWGLTSKQLKEFSLKEPEKHLSVIKEFLQEGKLMGFLYLIALSTPIVHLCDGNYFQIVLTGPSGVGKTTASLLAVRTFLNKKVLDTLNTTETGFELTLAKYKDLPYSFDEVKLLRGKDEMEAIERRGFMVYSKRGAIRGTKTLNTRETEIRSNVFISAETSIDRFSRLGAKRRILTLTIENTSDLSDKDLHSFKEYCGAGVLFIRWLMDNFKKYQKLIEAPIDTRDFKGLEKTVEPVLKTLSLLEAFYNQKFDAIKEITINRFNSTLSELQEGYNIVEKFNEDFMEFLTANWNKFIRGIYTPNGETYGIIEGEYCYILPEKLEEFLAKKGYHRKILLQALRKNNLLKTDSERMTIKKQINTLGRVRVYAIKIEGIEEKKDPFDNLI